MDARNEEAWISPSVDALALDMHGRAAFVVRFFAELASGPYHVGETLRQCYQVGYKSLPLVTLTGVVIGIVFTKHSRPALEEFGAASWLPSLVTIAIIRSLAPLVTGLVFSGRVGSHIGAELGSMTVTEQVEAMEVSGINPFKYLVVTRAVATTVMMPVLTLFAGFVGMGGSYLNVHQREQTSLAVYLSNGFSQIEFLDLWAAVSRSFVFGLTIGLISCYQGLNATKGTTGVGTAANTSVVLSMFAVFVEEILSTQIFLWFRY